MHLRGGKSLKKQKETLDKDFLHSYPRCDPSKESPLNLDPSQIRLLAPCSTAALQAVWLYSHPAFSTTAPDSAKLGGVAARWGRSSSVNPTLCAGQEGPPPHSQLSAPAEPLHTQLCDTACHKSALSVKSVDREKSTHPFCPEKVE